MKLLPGPVHHAEHRQRQLNRDRFELGVWPELFRLSCFAMGGFSSFLIAPLPYHRTGARSSPTHFTASSTASGTSRKGSALH